MLLHWRCRKDRHFKYLVMTRALHHPSVSAILFTTAFTLHRSDCPFVYLIYVYTTNPFQLKEFMIKEDIIEDEERSKGKNLNLNKQQLI
jgi:hypothetical protein